MSTLASIAPPNWFCWALRVYAGGTPPAWAMTAHKRPRGWQHPTTMTLRSLPISDIAAGTLWLGPMPGRFDGWGDFMAEARERQIDLVVCLTPIEEVESLSPKYWRAIADGSLDFRFINLPVQNFG